MSAENTRRTALMGLVSGDPVLMPAGQALLSKGSKQNKLNLGNGFVYDPETGETTQDPRYADFVAEREAAAAARAQRAEAARDARLAAQIGAQNDRFERGLTARSENVPFNQRVHAAEANRLAQEAHELFNELGRVGGVVSSPKDIAANALGVVPGVGTGAARVAEEQMFTPEQLAVKSRGRRFEQNLSNLAAGMALTGYELEQREKWSPFASGISQAEAKRRLTNLQRDFGDRRDAVLEAGSLRPGGESGTAPPQSAYPSKRVRVDAQGNVIGD